MKWYNYSQKTWRIIYVNLIVVIYLLFLALGISIVGDRIW